MSLPTSLRDINPFQVAAIAAPLLAYLLWQPLPRPKKLLIHASIPRRADDKSALVRRFREVYPEDYFEGGGYAALPHGKTHYYLLGPENAPKVVLICGLVTPAPIFSGLIKHLVKDFRVLLYDHYGRGYSDAPETEYTDLLYCTQIALLMQYVGWEKTHIVGVSMGGGIAAAFGAMFPKLILGKVVMIAPAGLLKNEDYDLKGKIIAHPVGEYIASSSIVRWYLGRKPVSVGNPGATASMAAAFADIVTTAQLQQVMLPYHIPAVSSTIRDGPLSGLESAFSELGANKDIAVLVFWGNADEVVPYKLSSEMLRRVPRAKLVTIDGEGHEIIATRADEIGTQTRDFLLS
ncbi:hypothetical protein FRB94_011693 [Tulasnella sp. JGI-2019a]|nr:hypothetical protein FRB94_011693 [Tulasnella sp. JGI-2019a]